VSVLAVEGKAGASTASLPCIFLLVAASMWTGKLLAATALDSGLPAAQCDLGSSFTTCCLVYLLPLDMLRHALLSSLYWLAVAPAAAVVWDGIAAVSKAPLDNKSCLFKGLAGVMAVMKDTTREVGGQQCGIRPCFSTLTRL
jgi:hypothetical protein